MPIFEYICTQCGNRFELLVYKMTDDPTCPHCNSSDVGRILSATASFSGVSKERLPGARDTGCCGSVPGTSATCAGPGSCCGKTGRK
ncbi:MAG: zinc ribbon domain-containing protein [Pseudomonadota bacterium]